VTDPDIDEAESAGEEIEIGEGHRRRRRAADKTPIPS
jgi:hypothetical protein